MLSQLIFIAQTRETREKLVDIFSIPKSGGVVVEGNRLISDGHTPTDLMAVTVDKMQEFLESPEEDFYKLFIEVIDKIENPERSKATEIEIEQIKNEENADKKAEAKSSVTGSAKGSKKKAR